MSNVRPGDPVAKYGPMDFESLIVDASAEQAHEVVDRLRTELETDGLAARVGIACYPGDGRSPEELMRRSCDAVAGTTTDDDPRIIVEAPAMKRLHDVVARAASSDINVLLLGETGVGKEVLAHRIHELSPRAAEPFVALCCAAFTTTLLESELFGYEKGAFTGATRAKPGLIETAERGTVFLDEIGDMPLALQAKLLRVLEAREVIRVGGLKPKPIDVRFVSATNRDLETDVASGRFRADLYFRLSGMDVLIPPLRERAADIEPLAVSFAEEAARRFGRSEAPLIDQEALSVLVSYAWPGNIRELRNVVDRATLLSTDNRIRREHLSIATLSTSLTYAEPHGAPPPRSPSEFEGHTTSPFHRVDLAEGEHAGDLHSSVRSVERQRIVEALEACGGNQSKAAKLLGISRTTLGARMETFKLPRPRKGKRTK